jgi:SulP family sulfate permease
VSARFATVNLRRVPLFTALRRAFAKGYGPNELRADIFAGIVVGVVALPLSMALAIAVGAPPQHGLYTAIVAGGITALFGGCKFQVTGPTAAFVVVLAPILTKHGLGGLLIAGMLAGVLLIAMGLARLGSLIHYIPQPVTAGFTAGIATVIATLQLKDLFGLQMGKTPEHYVDTLAALWSARSSARVSELAVALVTLALLLAIPRATKKVPAALIALCVAAVGSTWLHHVHPDFHVATIGSRFQSVVDGVTVFGIPSMWPSPAWPWGDHLPSATMIRDLIPAAFAIAMLGAIESLLSAVIADGMTNTKHDSNGELVALGLGNLIAPIFGGLAATGALARTATNIRAGARSPFAAVTHAVFVLAAMLALAPLLAYVPMASLAALLVIVAWNMSDARSTVEMLNMAPKSDVFVWVTCFVLTVFVDMVSAISVGFVLAAILFMRRMAELTESRLQLDRTVEGSDVSLPSGVVLYEINGPLFFGAAQKAMRVLNVIEPNQYRVLVIDLGRVPVIDATGLIALKGAIDAVLRTKRQVVLAGPLPRPREIFQKANLEATCSGLFIRKDVETAVSFAETLARPTLPAAAGAVPPPRVSVAPH